MPLEEPVTPVATAVSVIDFIAPTESPSPTPTERPLRFPTRSPRPTLLPTAEPASTWSTIRHGVNSLQFILPPEWVDFSQRLAPENLTTPLGILTALAASTSRTGASLLAGKPISSGGFMAALIAPTDMPPSVPIAGLGLVLARVDPAIVPLSDIMPLRAGSLLGATIDVVGMPLATFHQDAPELYTRIAYFLAPTGEPGRSVQVLFLFSAPAADWPKLASDFTRISETAVPPIWEAGVNVPAGVLRLLSGSPEQAPLIGAIAPGASDIWILSADSSQYLTLAAYPISENLDLALQLIDPLGQTLQRLNNGHRGNGEKATDLPLPATGYYLLVLSDFNAQSGRYELEAQLTPEPIFQGEGRLRVGEGVQSQLAAESMHVWRFAGIADQYISIVLQPGNEKLDAILNLYGPGGTRLVALDEGFSGDPEVVSGFQLPTTGDYAIRVSSFASAGGSYTLSLSQGRETTANFYDAGDLLVGQVKREIFRPNEAHAWFFQGRRDDEVIIRVTPLAAGIDVDVWLLDPKISRLAAQDQNLAGLPEILQQRLPEDGEYLILVRDFSGHAGPYEISLELTPAAVPVYEATLNEGQPATRNLPEGQTSFWLFNGEEGQKVTITLAPGNDWGDFVLILQAPNGETVLQVDAFGDGQPETISRFPLTATGQWRIVVREFYGEEAPYTVSVNWD